MRDKMMTIYTSWIPVSIKYTKEIRSTVNATSHEFSRERIVDHFPSNPVESGVLKNSVVNEHY